MNKPRTNEAEFDDRLCENVEVPDDTAGEENEVCKPTVCSQPKDVLDAIIMIVSHVCKSQLTEPTVQAIKPCTDFLQAKYGFNPIQSVIISMLIDAGGPLTTHKMSYFLGMRNTEFLRYEDDILNLVARRLLQRSKMRSNSFIVDVYSFRRKVREAILHLSLIHI